MSPIPDRAWSYRSPSPFPIPDRASSHRLPSPSPIPPRSMLGTITGKPSLKSLRTSMDTSRLPSKPTSLRDLTRVQNDFASMRMDVDHQHTAEYARRQYIREEEERRAAEQARLQHIREEEERHAAEQARLQRVREEEYARRQRIREEEYARRIREEESAAEYARRQEEATHEMNDYGRQAMEEHNLIYGNQELPQEPPPPTPQGIKYRVMDFDDNNDGSSIPPTNPPPARNHFFEDDEDDKKLPAQDNKKVRPQGSPESVRFNLGSSPKGSPSPKRARARRNAKYRVPRRNERQLKPPPPSTAGSIASSEYTWKTVETVATNGQDPDGRSLPIAATQSEEFYDALQGPNTPDHPPAVEPQDPATQQRGDDDDDDYDEVSVLTYETGRTVELAEYFARHRDGIDNGAEEVKAPDHDNDGAEEEKEADDTDDNGAEEEKTGDEKELDDTVVNEEEKAAAVETDEEKVGDDTDAVETEEEKTADVTNEEEKADVAAANAMPPRVTTRRTTRRTKRRFVELIRGEV